MTRQTRRSPAMTVLAIAVAMLTIGGTAWAQTQSTDPPPVETKVDVPEPEGPGVISISSRGNGPITVRQNGKTRVYRPGSDSSATQGRIRSAAAGRGEKESPRESRWRALLQLLESGEVAIYPRLSPEEMPDPPGARARAASTRAISRSGAGSGSITVSRPASNR